MPEWRPRERIEFDSASPRPSDVRLSKPFKTEDGDRIRALFTTSGAVILTPVGDTDSVLTSVVVTTTDDVDVVELSWGDIWKGIKKAATAVSDVLAGSGDKGGDKEGGKGKNTVTVTVNGNGNVTNIVIHQQ